MEATADTITWVLTSYIIASAVAIPVTGWLADRIGSRTLFLSSIAGFVLASMLCGMATSLAEMVTFRLLQGISAAFMNPLSQTVLMDINPPSKQARAMTIWAQGVMVGPILGPIVGGWLTESYNWRWCFYVNVPFGVGCFGLLWWLLPSREIKRRQLDALGFTMLAIALCAFQLMLDRGESQDWFASWEIRIEAMVAGTAFWTFLVQTATAKKPMFGKDLLGDRNLITGISFMLVSGMAIMSTMALLPPMLQSLYGYPVLTTGYLLIVRGVGVLVIMQLTALLIERKVDLRVMMISGLLIMAYSMYTMTGWSPQMGMGEFIVAGLIQGAGMGLMFSPMQIVAFGTLKPAQRTEGASLMNLARNLGASAGISTVTAVFARNVQVNHQVIGAHVPDTIGVVASDPLVTSAAGTSSEQVLSMADALVNQQAVMIAYLDSFKLLMVALLCLVPLTLLARPAKSRRAGEDDQVHVGFE